MTRVLTAPIARIAHVMYIGGVHLIIPIIDTIPIRYYRPIPITDTIIGATLVYSVVLYMYIGYL